MTASPPRRPRSQSQRRQETIQLLIDATIHCLVELGYVHTTTQAIAHKAGLSQGAIFRHFPTRQDLLIATAEALTSRFLEDYVAQLSKTKVAPGMEIDTALKLLQAVIASPNQIAWFELQLAARTDHALCEAFRPIFIRCQRDCIELARRLFPDLLDRLPIAAEAIQVLIQVFHGLTLDAHIEQSDKKQKRMLEVTTLIAKTAFAQMTGAVATPRASPAKTTIVKAAKAGRPAAKKVRKN